ncbi:MAG: ABC transporter ATP-binding protein [Deltaproteobacteria bacterium]|nr:ABC transporter ATP-binding protein [Deltaproteobacteria bacterium]MBI3293963.1 ABC transporter ATP-binding protein [Deltaproteobacteria bacterium]
MIEAETHSTVSLIRLTKRLAPSLQQHRWALGLGVILILVTTGLEILLPLWVGYGVDFAVQGNRAGLVRAAQMFLIIICSKALLDSILAYTIQSTGQRLMHALRGQVFEHIVRLPVAYFDKNPTGRLLTRVMNDIKSLGELFTASLSVLILDVAVILATIVAMLGLDVRLGGAILITFPIVGWVVVHFGELLNEGYRKVRLELSRMNAFLGENIAAIATIQRLGAEKERDERFGSIVNLHFGASMESLMVFAKVQPYANILNGVAMATLIGLGGYWVVHGRITLGVVVTFLGYIRNLFQPVRDLVEKYNNFLSARVSAERIGVILDEPGEDYRTGGASRDPAAEAVSFRNVTFTYPSRHAPAIDRISFSVGAGQSVAVVGPTGSGKSTLVRLILKFYEPQDGEILFWGHPLKDWNRNDLRSLVGVVHQEVYLVEGTLRENLCLGQRFDDEYLLKCARTCQLWEFVKERGGLEMKVYEGGTNLSVGERQLVAFTRILVFNPEVVVLDEATASLDRRLEGRLMSAVAVVLKGRTSIVVAHRLSTIQSCDHVLVMDRGHLIQAGTYRELAARPGLFQEYLQFHSAEEAMP